MNRLLWLLLLLSPSVLRAEGGGTPLIDVTDKIKVIVSAEDTPGGIRDFILWPNTLDIFYRDPNRNVMHIRPEGYPSYLTYSGRPLSRIVDPGNRYIVQADETAIWDTKNVLATKWTRYQVPGHATHLFWDRGYLYSLVTQFTAANEQMLSVYEYNARNNRVKKVCGTVVSNPDQFYRLAEGHEFPNVYLYQTFPNRKKEEWTLRLYEMHIGLGCKILGLETITRQVAGPLRSVHIYPRQNALAAEVIHPELNLYWSPLHNHLQAVYYDIGQGNTPYFPNHKIPKAMTYTEKEGLLFVDLQAAQKVRLSRPIEQVAKLPISYLGREDVWMQDDGSNLYMAPIFDGLDKKYLFKLNLASIY